ncbi:MAG: hypothetical protein K2K06_05780 [Oscillospiraceae bacterium]|nr:hypothetical protein [Oscillospiraceae bacterium]
MNSFLILTIVSVILCLGTGGILFQKRNIIEILTLGISWFFCSYILATMTLFVLDEYSLFRGIGITACLDLLLFLLVYLKYQPKKLEINWNIKKILIPVIIAVIGLAFVSQKNELFGMGQDEGVYQCVAINFMHGYDDRQQDFIEYDLLDSEESKKSFQTAVHNKLVGYDIPSKNYPDTVYDRTISPVSGIYHGIPTYAAMLALWGNLFGMAHMAEIQNIFYLLAILLLYFVCQNLNLKSCSAITACSLFALSPIVIWVAKSTLTEMFLAVLILLFLYFLTDKQKPEQVKFSVLPIAVFSCYHVSIYTILPYILLVYAGLYFFTRKNIFAILLNIMIPIYLASYFAMRQVQPFYTMNNYRSVFVGGVNVQNISQAVVITGLILEIICLVYFIIIDKHVKIIYLKKNSKFLKWLLVCLLALPILYIIYKSMDKLETLEESVSLTIIGFIENAGMLLIPVGIIIALLKSKLFLVSKEKLVIFISFFYCVLIYSSFLRFEIDYYDYYARYLVPFIPVAILFGVTAIDNLSKIIIYPVMIASLCFSMPYANFLRTHKDDTRMEWENLEDITMHINQNDCVVIENYYLSTLWLPIKAITQAHVYPAEKNIQEQLDLLALQYENVYLIASKSYTYDLDNNLEIIYTDMINCMEDKNTSAEKGMPLEFKAQARQIYLYSYLHDWLRYPASTINHYKLYGFGDYEKTFCWTNSENSAIRCILEQKDYDLTVNLASKLPLRELDREVFPVRLVINGSIVDTQIISDSNNGKSLVFKIPARYLQDGSNAIGFQTDIWEASIINQQDTRIVGIPIQSMVFEIRN